MKTLEEILKQEPVFLTKDVLNDFSGNGDYLIDSEITPTQAKEYEKIFSTLE